MERKTVQVNPEIKETLQVLKTHLKLNNESDVIKYLISLYSNSKEIPIETFKEYIELRR
jgi:hypothetical protein